MLLSSHCDTFGLPFEADAVPGYVLGYAHVLATLAFPGTSISDTPLPTSPKLYGLRIASEEPE